MKIYKPDPQYLNKLRLGITLVALTILLSGLFIALLVGLGDEADADVVLPIILIAVIANLLWWLPGLFLVKAYFDSLSYEIQADEVIVRAGILTKSVKHVPYRTVTNLTAKRDILDRWIFNLGTLNIQTAGMSGTTGAEESLTGLADVQEVYDIVATELRRFRGSLAPSAGDLEPEGPMQPNETLTALLAEVRAIRQALEKQE
jgi:membrane protein YdbS with pleckstrin-like domain